MNLLYFLVTINLLLYQLHCVVLVPSNQFELDFSKQTKSENFKKDQERNKKLSNQSGEAFDFCTSEEYRQKFISHDNSSQMIWITWNRTKATEVSILPNICSAENGLPLQRHCNRLGETAVWEIYDNKSVLIDCRLSMFCKPEAFEHDVVQANGDIDTHSNIWKQARIGEFSCLRDMCLQPNGLHLTRKCFYDAKEKRARFASVDHLRDIKCLQYIRQQAISNELNTLHGNITASSFISRNTPARHQTAKSLLSLLTKPKTTLLPADIQLTSDILKTIATDFQDEDLCRDILRIAHTIMSADLTVLRMSAELNATNSLLETFETYIDGVSEEIASNDKCRLAIPILNTSKNLPFNDNNDTSIEILNLSNIGVYAHITNNISVFFVNPTCANISGIAFYESYQPGEHMPQQNHTQNHIRYDSLNDVYYRFISINESINDILLENHLELAAFIPIDIWSALQKNFYKSHTDASVVVFKIYAHDGLFVEQNLLRSRKPFGKILSISLPGYTDRLPGPLSFILRHKSTTKYSKPSTYTGCGYWNYSTWIGSGVHTYTSHHANSDDLILCTTNHLTQFSYLLSGNYRQSDLSHEVLVTSIHRQALDIISLIGCSLSLLGLLGIWITAVLFKTWRSEASNKVLLNLCVALTLQMSLFLFVNTDDISEALVENHNYTKCIVLGALLQYSLLVLFSWMLIVAFLQFQRYVTVIGIQRPKHYIIKSAIVAWSVPLIPTILVALIDSKSYIPSTYQLATDTGICYPSGNGLRFGVVLPVSLIVLTNLSIFVYVFYSISRTLRMSMQRQEKHLVIKQIRLSILLFFLLGLSWIFGIFAFMKAGIVFSYLFCLTATLQGFILFIYFVLIDNNARNCWQKMLCPNCSKKSRSKQATELQSMTTASTSLTHETRSLRNH